MQCDREDENTDLKSGTTYWDRSIRKGGGVPKNREGAFILCKEVALIPYCLNDFLMLIL
jgi:hypothetical protein